ncbi:MAG: DMT family transporter [Oscillospiraceae bacterium]|jgi:drug/metabolite transporter (DMT)-like permease|nr:DMT family transporter [Oscillospiraceae bacterium]
MQHHQHRPHHPVYTFALLLAAMIWGFAFVAQVRGVEFMGSLTFGGARFLMGALSLLPMVFLFERKRASKEERRRTWRCGAVCGVVLFAASTLQQYGIEFTGSAGKSGFITGLYTVLVPIVSIFLGKRPSLLTGIGAVFAFGGLYFLSAPNGFGRVEPGDIFLVIGAVFWTLHILLLDAFMPKLRPLRFSVVQFLVCGLLSSAAALLFEQPTWHALRAGLTPLLYGGLLSVGVAYTLQTVSQRRVEPTSCAIIFSMEGLFAAIGGFFLLGERLGWKGYLGGGLMLAGILLSQLRPKKREAAS